MITAIKPTDALLVIDPQNDFCPGGNLAVEEGHEIMGGINILSREFYDAGALIVMTQDWHPTDHTSFATNNDLPVFSVRDDQQVMWPQHCVQSTWGASFHPEVEDTVYRAHAIIRKGYNRDVDSYSAFLENDKRTHTGLAGFLRDKGIERVFIVGLAFDYCVAYTAVDAAQLGLKTIVIRPLTRAIGTPLEQNRTSVTEAEDSFKAFGVEVLDDY